MEKPNRFLSHDRLPQAKEGDSPKGDAWLHDDLEEPCVDCGGKIEGYILGARCEKCLDKRKHDLL